MVPQGIADIWVHIKQQSLDSYLAGTVLSSYLDNPQTQTLQGLNKYLSKWVKEYTRLLDYKPTNPRFWTTPPRTHHQTTYNISISDLFQGMKVGQRPNRELQLTNSWISCWHFKQAHSLVSASKGLCFIYRPLMTINKWNCGWISQMLQSENKLNPPCCMEITLIRA